MGPILISEEYIYVIKTTAPNIDQIKVIDHKIFLPDEWLQKMLKTEKKQLGEYCNDTPIFINSKTQTYILFPVMSVWVNTPSVYLNKGSSIISSTKVI